MSNTNPMDQTIDTVTPLVGSASFGGLSRDTKLLGRYGISCLITRDTVDSDADVIVENSDDNSAWRLVELTNIAVTSGTPSNEVNKTYVPTRQFMRTRIVNKTANDLSATELVSTLRPI